MRDHKHGTCLTTTGQMRCGFLRRNGACREFGILKTGEPLNPKLHRARTHTLLEFMFGLEPVLELVTGAATTRKVQVIRATSDVVLGDCSG